jgi:hypothetical protein
MVVFAVGVAGGGGRHHLERELSTPHSAYERQQDARGISARASSSRWPAQQTTWRGMVEWNWSCVFGGGAWSFAWLANHWGHQLQQHCA